MEETQRTLSLPDVSGDIPSVLDLVSALSGLEFGMAPAWGKMSAVQMVRHCARFADLYLGRISVSWWVRLISRVAGPPFLRRFLTQPMGFTQRNLSTLPVLRVQKGEELDFDEEMAKLRDCLMEVETLKGTKRHVMYGPMKAEDVRAVVRRHTAHHFHQFGLI